MTTPTKEQCVQWAREVKMCNRQLKANEWVCTTDELHAFALKMLAESEAKTCKWTPWTDTGAIYDTECGGAWAFESGDIDDNGVKFCPYCAGKIDAAIERSE